jgi:IS30 family transposase
MLKAKRGLSTEQRAELWERWKDGQSLSDIGRALGKPPGSVHGFLAASGGIAPPARHRSVLALTGREREEISRQLCAGSSVRLIAGLLERAPSTVSREIRRNGSRDAYRAGFADSRAWAQAKRPKPCKLRQHRHLQRAVAQKLKLDWSPEQIAGWLRRTFPRDSTMQVSHETIYRSLFVQARGVLKRELLRPSGRGG